MTVTPTAYPALVTANAINMLAISATFQTLVGAADATAALNYIVDTWGGDPGRTGGQNLTYTAGGVVAPTNPPFAVVLRKPMASDLVGINTWNRKGVIEYSLYQARKLPDELPSDSMTRYENTHGGIQADIEAALGSANCLATGAFDPEEGPIFLNAVGAFQNAIFSILKLSWWA